MNDLSQTVQTKKQRWKEPTLLVGIGSLVATIIVGVATYWLTAGSASREYQEKIKAARNDVLTAVAKSIGEGVVPGKEKIQSVLNSVRRQYGIKEQDFETTETIIDDILARVLANEFLDAKRREELSYKLLVAKAEKLAGSEEKKPTLSEIGRLGADRPTALVIAFASSIIAAMTLMLMTERFKRVIKQVPQEGEGTARSRDRPELLLRQVILMITALVVIVFVMWLLFTLGGKASDIWPFL